ncbi:hypothetical protein SDC9_58100 [bioreactor metagenome]|uniref:Putative amidase domain-containing protein n=1 Tax=bioreactor metagenome TaxID=1076179 RepID=A0A644X6Q2_9ZZZZ
MPLTVVAYDRIAAVGYAHRWAFSRNPRYYNYDKIGGDCTNFASQCLFAGTGVMNYTPVYGWFYNNANNKAPSWTGVQYFYNFMTRGKPSQGPFCVETALENIEIGDLIQLSFRDNQYQHTPVVVAAGDPPAPQNILLAAHTFDADYRPMSTYSYEFYRCLHILGTYTASEK